MPRIRENAQQALKENEKPKKEVKRSLRKKKTTTTSTSTVPNSIEEYSPRSSVFKTYQAGDMPIDHKRLLEGIKNALGEAKEGVINLGEVLKQTGIFRASALKMLKHMENFGVIESKSQYHGTWVKVLKD